MKNKTKERWTLKHKVEKKNTVSLKAAKMILRTWSYNNPLSSVPVNPTVRKFSYLLPSLCFHIWSPACPKLAQNPQTILHGLSCACKVNMCLKEFNNKSCRSPFWFKYSWCWSQSRVSSSSFSIQQVLEMKTGQCWFSTPV